MRIAVLTLAGLGIAGGARAQAFDVPSFMPPRPGDDIGAYISTLGDFGIQGIWRQQGSLNLGLRLGFIDYDFDDAITVGAETWGGIVRAGPEFPLDVTWTLGLGAGFNGGTTLFEVPLGLSMGRMLDAGTLPIQLYGHPRIALVHFSSDVVDDTDLEFLFDLGADFHISPDWKLR
ncbi:MAG: hypothetical protein GWN02_30820, partial [Gemmatimonadetes bacterium]|nr:hypothetical protein [Gemmatimonadota bacterium]NIW36654.1 hypothetical protein [Gemmatimonadota bacterium]NIY12399.1 hypothetical protein [Gemmatimonadota bacterium]